MPKYAHREGFLVVFFNPPSHPDAWQISDLPFGAFIGTGEQEAISFPISAQQRSSLSLSLLSDVDRQGEPKFFQGKNYLYLVQ